MNPILALSILLSLSVFQVSCQREDVNKMEIENQPHSETIEDDLELESDYVEQLAVCAKATLSQITQVNLGNTKLDKFLKYCRDNTAQSPWCDQVARPNPASHNTFDCTYNTAQQHNLIHPDESTWPYAVQAVKLVKELQLKNIKVCTIYNWWRPEPYNKNVGGAAGRHPFGTSVDVRFCSKNDQLVAHRELCKMRKQGRLRALGYYSSTSLHFGIGDKVANTWGKACP